MERNVGAESDASSTRAEVGGGGGVGGVLFAWSVWCNRDTGGSTTGAMMCLFFCTSIDTLYEIEQYVGSGSARLMLEVICDL